ncbi:MAG: hypothetical protein WCL23_00605 [Candidatus Moraniibacteriota bacterium]
MSSEFKLLEKNLKENSASRDILLCETGEGVVVGEFADLAVGAALEGNGLVRDVHVVYLKRMFSKAFFS